MLTIDNEFLLSQIKKIIIGHEKRIASFPGVTKSSVSRFISGKLEESSCEDTRASIQGIFNLCEKLDGIKNAQDFIILISPQDIGSEIVLDKYNIKLDKIKKAICCYLQCIASKYGSAGKHVVAHRIEKTILEIRS